MRRLVLFFAAVATLATCSARERAASVRPGVEFDAWIDAERRVALVFLLQNVSPTGTFHKKFETKFVADDRWPGVRAESARPGDRLSLNGAWIRQTITPVVGVVVAAPLGKRSEPDYFFHWVRDSALVMGEIAGLASNSSGCERADLLRR